MTNASGLSAPGLKRLHEVVAGYVERGELPGAVTLVSRRGEISVDAIGNAELDAGPMRPDTIFRIASMTKPIIAVGTLILAEECVLRLDDPVDRWLPELADRQVLTRPDAAIDDTVPANRQLTVRDLLDFRLGIGMTLDSTETPAIARAEAELGLGVLDGPNPAAPHTPDEWIRRFGTLPLMFQPGERWAYNTGSQVLGVLLVRASGKPLETFLAERIFEPLGMRDTGFSVPVDKLDRLPTAYAGNSESGALDVIDGGGKASMWAHSPAFPDGAGGLVSTANDYGAFAEMLLGRGRRGSVRILSRPSVELMTTDQLTREQRSVVSIFGDHTGWGLGVSVDLARRDISMTPGRYGWAGGLGTSWHNDPAEQLIGICLSQRTMIDFTGLYHDFWNSLYAAIDD